MKIMYMLMIGAGINSVVECYPQWYHWKKYMKNQEYNKKESIEEGTDKNVEKNP